MLVDADANLLTSVVVVLVPLIDTLLVLLTVIDCEREEEPDRVALLVVVSVRDGVADRLVVG